MNRTIRKAAMAVLTAASLVSAMPSKSEAYCYYTCNGNKVVWDAGWCNLYLNRVSFTPGGTWDLNAQWMMSNWNALPRCGFLFYTAPSSGSISHSDGYTEGYFKNIDGAGGTLGVTYLRFSLCVFSSSISEADVAFDVAEAWYTGSPRWSTSGISFESVALHEFGHVLGECHSNGQIDTMNSYYPNGGPIGRNRVATPHADARKGARYLYPQSGSTVRDVALTNFKRTGTGTSGLISQPTSAARGATVNLQCTLEGFGSVSSVIDIGFYLSTNDIISTGDRYLGTWYGATIPNGWAGTINVSLYIPMSTPTGSYYIGSIADVNNAVAEADESNNALAAPLKVTIY